MKRYSIGSVVVVCLAIVAVGVLTKHEKKPHIQVAQSKGGYVALGDSVAAGVGLKTDSDSSACNRTDQAYPHVVAKALHYNLRNITCSGATLLAGISGQQDVNQLLVTPQLDQLYAMSRPKLVTLTIGANDSHWTDVIGACYAGECGTSEQTAAVTSRLATVSADLTTALDSLTNHYKSKSPKILVTGYYQPLPPEPKSCSDLTGIDASELTWARQQQASLNDSIKAVTSSYQTVSFVPINFDGHELCTTDSWVQGLTDKQPYHPTQAGQAAIAKQIEAALQ